MLAAKLLNQIRSAETVMQVFAHVFPAAVKGLGAAELKRLDAAEVNRSAAALGWVETPVWNGVLDQFRLLSARQLNSRYRFKPGQLGRLQELLGLDFAADPRRLFIVAIAIDQAYGCFREDHWQHPWLRTQVLPAPVAVLSDVANRPPPIGQMTPLAIARRWLQHLWFVGRLDNFRALGDLPVPTPMPLPARVALALEDAAENRCCRIGLAQWPRHVDGDLQLARHDGTFAVVGYRQDSAPTFADLIRQAREAQLHILLFPELALDPTALTAVQLALRGARGRFPTLVAAGLVHSRPGNDESSFRNDGVLLDSEGNELLRHEKLEPFTHVGLGLENIVPRATNVYAFTDTPLGRLVVNVCRDVRSDLPMILNRALGASIVLVPAYSRELTFAAEEARVLGARQNAITACTNGANEGLIHRGYVYAPLRGSTSSVTWSTAGTASTDLLVAEVTAEGGTARLNAKPAAR